MLYGRRTLTPQRVPEGNSSLRLVLEKRFQYKYTGFMVTAIVGGAALFLFPSLYFINQNYELFKTLAFDTHPYLVEHLEREISWLKLFLIASLTLMMGLTFLLSIKMTRNILAPLVKMERHMHSLMLGHWHIPDYPIPEREDFRDLSLTYDYFYRSLKANTEAELKLLEKLSIDPQNREAYTAWRSLINEKRARLGLNEEFISNENVVSLNEFDQKRHVS